MNAKERIDRVHAALESFTRAVCPSVRTTSLDSLTERFMMLEPEERTMVLQAWDAVIGVAESTSDLRRMTTEGRSYAGLH